MDVRVYREKPIHKELQRSAIASARGNAPGPKRNAQALWDYLVTQSQASK